MYISELSIFGPKLQLSNCGMRNGSYASSHFLRTLNPSRVIINISFVNLSIKHSSIHTTKILGFDFSQEDKNWVEKPQLYYKTSWDSYISYRSYMWRALPRPSCTATSIIFYYYTFTVQTEAFGVYFNHRSLDFGWPFISSCYFMCLNMEHYSG